MDFTTPRIGPDTAKAVLAHDWQFTNERTCNKHNWTGESITYVASDEVELEGETWQAVRVYDEWTFYCRHRVLTLPSETEGEPDDTVGLEWMIWEGAQLAKPPGFVAFHAFKYINGKGVADKYWTVTQHSDSGCDGISREDVEMTNALVQMVCNLY